MEPHMKTSNVQSNLEQKRTKLNYTY
jgi:hypothetical protein